MIKGMREFWINLKFWVSIMKMKPRPSKLVFDIFYVGLNGKLIEENQNGC